MIYGGCHGGPRQNAGFSSPSVNRNSTFCFWFPLHLERDWVFFSFVCRLGEVFFYYYYLVPVTAIVFFFREEMENKRFFKECQMCLRIEWLWLLSEEKVLEHQLNDSWNVKLNRSFVSKFYSLFHSE